jgi:hypothetical protein
LNKEVAERPGRRFYELIGMHAEMHVYTGDPRVGITPGDVFPGFSVLPYVLRIKRLLTKYQVAQVLDYGSGKGYQYADVDEIPASLSQRLRRCLKSCGGKWRCVPDYWGVPAPTCYDPAYMPHSCRPHGKFDGVVCTDVLEHCPEEDIDWIIADLFGYAERLLFVSVACTPARKHFPNGKNVHSTVKSAKWWAQQFVRFEKRNGTPFEVWTKDTRIASGNQA